MFLFTVFIRNALLGLYIHHWLKYHQRSVLDHFSWDVKNLIKCNSKLNSHDRLLLCEPYKSNRRLLSLFIAAGSPVSPKLKSITRSALAQTKSIFSLCTQLNKDMLTKYRFCWWDRAPLVVKFIMGTIPQLFIDTKVIYCSRKQYLTLFSTLYFV